MRSLHGSIHSITSSIDLNESMAQRGPHPWQPDEETVTLPGGMEGDGDFGDRAVLGEHRADTRSRPGKPNGSQAAGF